MGPNVSEILTEGGLQLGLGVWFKRPSHCSLLLDDAGDLRRHLIGVVVAFFLHGRLDPWRTEQGKLGLFCLRQ